MKFVETGSWISDQKYNDSLSIFFQDISSNKNRKRVIANLITMKGTKNTDENTKELIYLNILKQE